MVAPVMVTPFASFTSVTGTRFAPSQLVMACAAGSKHRLLESGFPCSVYTWLEFRRHRMRLRRQHPRAGLDTRLRILREHRKHPGADTNQEHYGVRPLPLKCNLRVEGVRRGGSEGCREILWAQACVELRRTSTPSPTHCRRDPRIRRGRDGMWRTVP